MPKVSTDLQALPVRLSWLVKKTIPDRVADFQRLVTLELLSRIVPKTPVDEGRARGNWQTTIGQPAQGEKGNFAEDPIAAGRAILSTLRPFGATFLTNNAPYIRVLEFGLFNPPNPGPSKDPRPRRFGRILVQDGFSIQAPEGMVRVSVRELELFLRSVQRVSTPRRRLRNSFGQFISERGGA
jgi:hypothetical protein